MIKNVTILGANGNMGKNVAAIWASFGNCNINLVVRNLDDKEYIIKSAIESVKADSIITRLNFLTYDELEKCIPSSDFIFESVSEQIDIKREVFKKIIPFLNEETIIGTGTSGLSVEYLAEILPNKNRKNFYGIHFFNPPYNLTLCELIKTRYNSESGIKELKEYLEKKLFRDVIVVKDEPAFLGNRIGFFFINRCLQLAEKYKENGGIDYIDTIFGGYTGRAMAPIVTSNFVGLDVHKAIVNNVSFHAINKFDSQSFQLPNYVDELIEKKYLGRKVGIGFYQKEIDGKEPFVFDIASKKYREKEKYSFHFSNQIAAHIANGEYEEAAKVLKNNDSLEAKICLELLLEYILYSLQVTEIVGETQHAADIAMATGFNWVPPLALCDYLGGEKEFKALCWEKLSAEAKSYYEAVLNKKISHSNYDFRSFIKGKV
ncbi:3-hydroxyacyl-CoA dehydrogenase family protein [Enterococcus faecium]|uniref:3-hydroxyacyl-CoA dehydrogenase family protein n=1 Tax=Enterococcus TaxID=1350 RepID=UPI0013756E04|nr:3-hydroxyacyl-CoA dehydrogenase family protein [Enterococcus faecium]EMF0480963.1 3-hydroxyacyl-CoA dehydrogenase family protein [Enterococcus faecium]HJG22840.1 3-hydroxyacyl-CoA dehydrogenase family protein [Enterococcus durans]